MVAEKKKQMNAPQGQKESAEKASPEGKSPTSGHHIEFLHDVTLQVSVEFGRNDLSINDVLKLQRGSVIELTKDAKDPLEVRVNGNLVGKGEAVVVNDKYGLRVTEILNPDGTDLMLE